MSNKGLKIVKNLEIEEKNIDKLLNTRQKILNEPGALERIELEVDKKFSDEQQEIILKTFKAFCYENDIDYKKRSAIGLALLTVYGRIIRDRIENLRVYHMMNIGKKRLIKNMGVGPTTICCINNALSEYGLSLNSPISDSELVYFERQCKTLSQNL